VRQSGLDSLGWMSCEDRLRNGHMLAEQSLPHTGAVIELLPIVKNPLLEQIAKNTHHMHEHDIMCAFMNEKMEINVTSLLGRIRKIMSLFHTADAGLDRAPVNLDGPGGG